MEIERNSVRQDPQTGSSEVVHTQEHVPSQAAVGETQANKADAYVWYVIGVIDVLLALRFAFLLLGAQNTGFASILYQVSYPFMALFKGIFPSPGSSTGYFDTAAVLAVIVYLLLGWGIVSLIDINKRNRAV